MKIPVINTDAELRAMFGGQMFMASDNIDLSNTTKDEIDYMNAELAAINGADDPVANEEDGILMWLQDQFDNKTKRLAKEHRRAVMADIKQDMEKGLQNG